MIGVALAALTLASCEKELEQVDSSPQSAAASLQAKPDLLTTGDWHQTGLTVSSATEGSALIATSDLFAQAKPSMLVKVASYKADGTYSLMRGARAGSAFAEPVTGKWRLNAAADSLIVTQGDQTRHLAVTELTASTLSLTYTDGGASGKPSTYTSVFSH
ncbi:hypothetical protein GCM10022407_09210 [Hymenobacter antarcticus]|uniref:Lipocalin-like domain-containing protein n=2 Tax=Hymenobacter antarcticus TaxID=486270 RepID=A0ABP7PFH0_9BACT